MRHLTPAARRGFTLIEVLVAVAMFGVVALVITKTLITSQRVTTAQTAHAQMQSNLRVASELVPNELRMLNQAASTDIQAISDTSIVYFAMRGYYMLCSSVASTTALTVARVTSENYSFDYRMPAAGDSIFIFFEGDTLKMTDDAWVPAGISAVASGTCTYPPTGGGVTTPGGLTFTLTGAINTASYPLSLFYKGAPVRSYEITRMSLFTASDGNKFLGMCTGSDSCALQPVVGPLADAGGFLLTRYDDQGNVVTGTSLANRNSLRSMRIRFVGKTEQAIARAGANSAIQTVTDTLSTVVTLRNVKQN